MKSIKKKLFNAFFPSKFENEKIESLNNFINENNCDTEYWSENGLLSKFKEIIQTFDEKDFNYFIKSIKKWNSDELAILAEKIVDENIKSITNQDLGIIYAEIFLQYENFDSYCLIDELESVIKIYDSKLDFILLINLTNKIKILYDRKLISKERFDYNLSFIKNLQNDIQKPR